MLLKNIAYNALIFIQLFSITLELKFHLEQTFAWGPQFNNMALNNTPKKVTKRLKH